MLTSPAISDSQQAAPASQKLGKYEVRFAETAAEIEAAQALRFQVFYEEKHGMADEQMLATKRASDRWDQHARIIIVLDRSSDELKVVGTLRLTHKQQLPEGSLLYTEDYFDLSRLYQHYPQVLELSRFCIDSKARGGTILMLIWKYAMAYILDNSIELMVGCASFNGTDVDTHLPILSYLHHHHRSAEHLMPDAIVQDAVYIPDLILPDSDWQEAQHAVPTLLRGYLKLGAKISDHAIIDPFFNTVFVAIYVETKDMLARNPLLVAR